MLLFADFEGADASAGTAPALASFHLGLEFYERTLGWALRHTAIVMLALFGTVCLTVFLFGVIPKGFFPEQDTGRLIGAIQADQSISFQAMQKKMAQLMAIVQADPAVSRRRTK